MEISNRLCTAIFIVVMIMLFLDSDGLGEDTEKSKVDGTINSPGCGKRNLTSSVIIRRKRVVGGRYADLGSWPWMVAIYRNRTGKNYFSCGGTLISDQHVLTVAHCVSNTGYNNNMLSVVRVGDLDLEGNNDGATPVDVLIEAIIPHQNFSAHNNNNNIAIIKLKTPVKFSRFIQPLCLPDSVELKDNLFLNKRLYITGWGVKQTGYVLETRLKENTVPVVSLENCKKIFTDGKVQIDDTVICAGEMGADACQGDSGGPLTILDGDKYYLIGLSSSGKDFCGLGEPSVYTRVSSYIDWIKTNIKWL